MRKERYSPTFQQFLRFLEESQWWSLEDLREYQNERLRGIVRHAYETVPYYSDLMRDLKLTPDDIRTVADLPKLPLLTKETVRKQGDRMICRTIPRREILRGKTGGTTGKALDLFYDKHTHAHQWGVWWRHRSRFGLDFNDWFVVFAGRKVVPNDTLRPPIWRVNYPMHQIYVSVHHMTEGNMKPLVEYLKKKKVRYYSGYPSGVYLLAKYLVDNSITLPHPPEVIVLGAESLLSHQKQLIQKAFPGSVVTDQYGSSESCINISECEQGSYHIDMEFGAVELLKEDGRPDTFRRIVGTGFWNFAMPLIRYDIGDTALLAEKDFDCKCGRKSPVVQAIDGRVESYIITPDGRQLGRLDFLFKDTSGINEAQLVQYSAESVTFKLVRNHHFNLQQEKQLISTAREYLGDVIRIDLEYLDEIPRTANGKFRQIVSEVGNRLGGHDSRRRII